MNVNLIVTGVSYVVTKSESRSVFSSGLWSIIRLFVILISVPVTLVVAQIGQYKPDSAVAVNLWQINQYTELYAGASFYYMNPDDSIIVWCDTSESDKTGELYIMVPGYADSALFLFTNRERGKRINVSEALGVAVPVHTEIFFMYRLQVSDSKPRYTGQNRVGIDPTDQANYPGAEFVSQDVDINAGSKTKKDYGHRWAVAGRIRDNSGDPTDTLIFGFEDDNYKLNPASDSVVADHDFNDVIFRVTGLQLNVEPYPDSIALTLLGLSGSAARAGDTIRCYAKVWADSAGIRMRSKQFDSLIQWQLSGAGINRDTLKVLTNNDTTALFIGKTSGATCVLRAWFISPYTGDTVTVSRPIPVIPGPPSSLSIERQADTGSTDFSMNRPVLIPVLTDRIQIASNQISRPVYALLRDRYGNFTGFSRQTVWDTLAPALPGIVNGIAQVTNGDKSIGEGIVTKSGGSGDIWVRARDTAGTVVFSDTVRINVVGASYDMLRLLTKTSTDSAVVASVRLSTDQCTTLIAQGRRTDDSTSWETIDVQWDFTFPWNSFDASIPQSNVVFCPADTGKGTLTIVHTAFVKLTVPLQADPGKPVRLTLYHKQVPLPADTTVQAGRRFDCSGYLFDKRGVWLPENSLVSGATPLVWKVIESTALIDTLDSTGAIAYQRNFDAGYTPVKAYRTVALVVEWGGMTDTCRLSVLPGPPYRLVIEPSGDWRQSPHQRNPIDTVEIPDTRTSMPVYAFLRDSLGNYVDSLRYGQWGSRDTIVSIASGTPACRGTIVKNIAIKDGTTQVFVTAAEGGFSDSAYVVLLPYHFIDLRISSGSGVPIDSLTCTTNDDTTIIVEALRSDTALWREIDGTWSASASVTLLPPPPAAKSRYTFSPEKAGTGWIAATLVADALSDTLAVRFLPGKPLWASLQLLTPADKRIAGDTMLIAVKLFNRHGLLEGTYCFSRDSSSGPVYYLDSLGDGGRSKKPQAIIDNSVVPIVTPEHLGNGSPQCFKAGTDTIGVVLYYAPATDDSLHRIRFLVAADELTAATPPFRLLPGPLASIKITHNKSTTGTDTLVLQAPQDSVLLSSIGYDAYGNARGEIASMWSTSGSLHAVGSSGPLSRIWYSSAKVIDDETGAVRASAVIDSLLRSFLPIRIRGPLATVVSAITRDESGNGLLDCIDLTFSLPIAIGNGTTVARDMAVTFRGETLPVDRVVKGTKTTELRVMLREQSATEPQTDWTPLVAFRNQSFSLDGAADTFAIVCSDGAGPVLWEVTKKLIDADNRSLDRVTVAFSEKVYGRTGQPLSLNQPPDTFFNVWFKTPQGTFEKVALLEGINSIYAVPAPDTLIFIMKNGNDLTNQHYFNLRAGSESNSNNQSMIIDVSNGNMPRPDNQKVKVIVTGTPTGKLVVAPNPMRPTSRREPPGTFHLQNNPRAKEWVIQDGAGTMIQFKIALPEEKNVTVDGKVTIFDFVGNRVASDPVSYINARSAFGDEDRIYMNEISKNILPSSWTPDGSVYDYYIYWNGYTLNGVPTAPGVYRVSLMIIITTSKGKETRWFSNLIGVRR